MKFRMVDRILAWEPWQSIRGVKTVSFEEYSLVERLGQPPHLPEMLLLETFFQLGNWLVMLSSDFATMGLIVRTREVRFHSTVRPGERLTLELAVEHRQSDGISLRGQGWVGRREIAAGFGCLAVPAPLRDYCDPDDLRTLYSEIHRPVEQAAV